MRRIWAVLKFIGHWLGPALILLSVWLMGKPVEYRNIPGGWHSMLIGPKRLVLDSMDSWLTRVTAAEPYREIESLRAGP